MTWPDIVGSAALILLVMEATRRVLGWALPLTVLFGHGFWVV